MTPRGPFPAPIVIAVAVWEESVVILIKPLLPPGPSLRSVTHMRLPFVLLAIDWRFVPPVGMAAPSALPSGLTRCTLPAIWSTQTSPSGPSARPVGLASATVCATIVGPVALPRSVILYSAPALWSVIHRRSGPPLMMS